MNTTTEKISAAWLFIEHEVRFFIRNAVQDFLLSFVSTKCRRCYRVGWKQTRLRTAVTAAATQGEAQDKTFFYLFYHYPILTKSKYLKTDN